MGAEEEFQTAVNELATLLETGGPGNKAAHAIDEAEGATFMAFAEYAGGWMVSIVQSLEGAPTALDVPLDKDDFPFGLYLYKYDDGSPGFALTPDGQFLHWPASGRELATVGQVTIPPEQSFRFVAYHLPQGLYAVRAILIAAAERLSTARAKYGAATAK
jgi:hypothetical protein